MRVLIGGWLLIAVPALAADPPVTALTFAPDGKSVLIGSQAGVAVRTWPDLASVRSVTTELAHVHDLAFAPDGKTLAIAGGAPAENGVVEFRRWPDGALLHRVRGHKDVVYAVAWSADSATLLTASADTTVRRIDAGTGKTVGVLEGHSRGVLAATYLPGGREVVTAGLDETLRVWDLGTGQATRVLSNHSRPVSGLALRPGGEAVVASIAGDRTVRVWQPALGRMVRFARLNSEPRALAWSTGGDAILVACADGSVRAIDPETVEVRATVPAVEGPAHALAVAADGSVLVGGPHGQLKRVVPSSPK